MAVSIIEELMLITAGVTVGYQLFFFFIAAYFKFDKVTDFAGGTNFVVLALITFVGNGRAGDGGTNRSTRQWVDTLLVLAWGTRLSAFLLYRILKTKEDHRFDGIREDLIKFGAFWVFQMIWVWIVSLPITYLNSIDDSAAARVSAADIAGWALAAGGLVLESVADMEKFSFRQDQSEGKPAFLNAGTWAWSRHPNYFGELCFWWGVFITTSSTFGGSSAASGNQWGYLTIASPLFITFLLLLGSGLPIVERSTNRKLGSDPAYLIYRRSTPVLFPCPPGLGAVFYAPLPAWVKKLVCFEWYDDESLVYGGLQGGLLEKS